MIRTGVLLSVSIGAALLVADDLPAVAPKELAAKLQSEARYHQSQGDYAEAEASARRLLALLESNGLQDSLMGANALNDLAVICRLRDRLPEAESLNRRALAIFRNLAASAQVAATTNNLGAVALAQGRWKEARGLYLQAISLWRETRGPESPEIAAGLTNLALLYQSRHDYGKAAALVERAMKIDRAAYPPDHPRIALDLTNRAVLAAKQKHYPEAESMLLRALRALETSLPRGHPDIGTTAGNLAEVYRLERRYGDAEPLYRTSIRILEKVWGPDDRRLLPYFEYYAEVLRAREEYAEAAQADLRATRIGVVHTLR
jgi:tetratricopeptide (TPR) repeat protein